MVTFFIIPCSQTNTGQRNSKSYSVEPKIAVGKNIKSLLLKGFELKPADDFWKAAKLCLSIKIVPSVLQRQRNL
jgi:hypothetical protein